MYTEKDRWEIRGRLAKYCAITAVLLGGLLTVYVMGMICRWGIGVMVCGVLMFILLLFMIAMYIYPCGRYGKFLTDMERGLRRTVDGRIVEISEQEDLQDGVRVLPVRILLCGAQDERIVYLNVSKRSLFPEAGTEVHLSCFGRHICSVEVI